MSSSDDLAPVPSYQRAVMAVAQRFGVAATTTMLATLALFIPGLAGLPILWGFLAQVQSGARARKVEEQLALHRKSLGRHARELGRIEGRLDTLSAVVAELHAAPEQAVDTVVDLDLESLDLRARDVRGAVTLYLEASAADDEVVEEALVRACLRAVAGEARGQLEIAAIDALGKLTAEGLELLQASGVQGELKGRTWDEVDPLKALGLLDVQANHVQRRRSHIGGGLVVSTTSVGRAVLRLTAPF